MRPPNKALFLDLDGTIIVTASGHTFPTAKDDWKFKEGILHKIEQYVEAGYYIMIVSNQGGIEAGHILLNDFRQKMRQVVDRIIVSTGCPFSRLAYRFSMSNNIDDFFRKPNPGMGYDLALSHILNLSQCLMVGDASGKVKRVSPVFKDASSPSSWSYKEGQHVSSPDAKLITVDPIGVTGTIYFHDHSDSDLKFALSCGMSYIDVEEFIALPSVPNANV